MLTDNNKNALGGEYITNIVIVQQDLKGAREFTRVAKLQDFVKNNELHFDTDAESGKEVRSALFNAKNEKTHTVFSFKHVNIVGKSDKGNPDAYHP